MTSVRHREGSIRMPSVLTLHVRNLSAAIGNLFPHLASLQRQEGRFLNMDSCLVRAAVVLLATAQDDTFFSAVAAKFNLDAASAVGHHRWHLMLPTSARVSPVTYAADSVFGGHASGVSVRLLEAADLTCLGVSIRSFGCRTDTLPQQSLKCNSKCSFRNSGQAP